MEKVYSSLKQSGKYHYIKTIGEGEFGKVKLAYSVSDDKKVWKVEKTLFAYVAVGCNQTNIQSSS